MDELDVLGEEVVDAVLVDGVGMAAADLHQLVVAVGVDLVQDLSREHPAQIGVAELVDELHARHLGTKMRDRCTGMDQELVAFGHGADQGNLDGFRLARLVRAQRQRAIGVHPHNTKREGYVTAGDALTTVFDTAYAALFGVHPLRLWGESHSITLALSSSSSCS